MKENKYYRNIDIIRFISCLFVLLYHLNILKGGYLAVCTFFVLSGYLSCISLFSKKKISLKEYYLNKLKKIYLPLLIVVFITISIINLLPNISWLNLKPETTSVILGYNNYWQINANLDYFARHVSSPFMHFWYIAILLQFDLLFPPIFIILKKVGEKTSKLGMTFFLTCITIISTAYFYIMSKNASVMTVYYSTLTRMFSIFCGITLGFITTYYETTVPKSLKKHSNIIFIIYLILYTLLSVFIKSDSKFFGISMILVSIISMRLIAYATVKVSSKLTKSEKILKYLSSITYEIYLIQYPVIFLLQGLNLPSYLYFSLVILTTVLLSAILNFILKGKKIKKEKVSNKILNILKYVLLVITILILLNGIYVFVTAKDHTEEMKQLEEELAANSKVMEEKQKEYIEKMKQEEDEWQNTLKNLENGEAELNNVVSNLPIVGIGDSVMLGALNNLYAKFTNSYFDAKISRTDWEANKILLSLKNNNMLGSTIIFNLGTNGACPESCRREIIATCEDREIYYVNVTNDKDVHVNSIFESMQETYPNVHVIDWNSYSANHPEYFIADGIHLTEVGREAYTNCIYESIYNVYLEKLNKEKEELLKKHEEEKNSKYTFLGNDLLLNIYEDIHKYYKDSIFYTDKNYNYKTLYNKIEKEIENKTLNNNVVIILDNTLTLRKEEVTSLIHLLENYNVYFISMNKDLSNYLKEYEKVKVYDFYKKIETNKDYLMVDNIHLTEKGNTALSKIIKALNTK